MARQQDDDARPRPPARGRSRKGPVVAVTAAASPAGVAITAALQAASGSPNGPRRVIAVDDPERPHAVALPADTELRRADVASPEVMTGVEGADVVVHVAAPDDLDAALTAGPEARRLRAVRAMQAVGTAAAAAGARHLVVVTSAMVHGARADNPVPLPEDAPLAAEPDDGLVGDLLQVEHVLSLVPTVHPGLSVTVVRPAALAGPGVDTVMTRHFEAPRLLVLRGAPDHWQFCHVEDLGSAIVTVVRKGITGSVTVGADGLLGGDELERISGMRRLEVPKGVAFGTAERLHKLGVMSMPGSDLAYVVHPWAVGSQRLHEAGWKPLHSNADCLAAVMETVHARQQPGGPRRVDRRDAALGAAGAAVALAGTAAILRQARSRQAKRRRPTINP